MTTHDLAPAERLVLVAWLDAKTEGSWSHPPFETELAASLSAGWIIAEDDEAVTVAGSAGVTGSFGDRTSIPRVNIVWVRPLLALDRE